MYTEEQLNRLDCMNYQVTVDSGHYYIQDGVVGLRLFAISHGLELGLLMDVLLGEDGQYEGEGFSVTMI